MATPDRTGARKPTKTSVKTTSLKLPAELKERLQKVADARRRSAHWAMLEAIERYVSYEEWRDEIWRDAIEGLKEMEETGLHLTGEEVNEWLRRRAAGEDVELPECHT
jgi:predicted transcriptional regulator